jgi:DNA polymerase I-like protein with 3'-5' exonuclease and polymerase domains
MFVSADVKSLEVICAGFLSQDRVLCSELGAGLDLHGVNQARFKLPTRLVSKRFTFKLIYGATAWGYANDADFVAVSRSKDYWQKVIDEFYDKYTGIRHWHADLLSKAVATGTYISPTGRQYSYLPHDVVAREWFWRPKILNYPVQGLGADLVMLGRIIFWNRLKKSGFSPALITTSVHDEISVDTTSELCYNVGSLLKESIEAIPSNFTRLFGTEFTLPLSAEIKAGPTLAHMEKIEC